jgi:peptidyl-prolyl cis-trans isomerase A (cyclophilin A)
LNSARGLQALSLALSAARIAFIVLAEGAESYLDGKHTIFGQVLSGQEVAVAISAVPTGSDDRPKIPVIVKSVTIHSKR